MPYYVYKITHKADAQAKQLEYLSEFPSFIAAKKLVKSQRIELQGQAGVEVRIMFADSTTDAERRLTEQRSKPILEEWET